ncbi:MAG: ABC transporter ATP-binding protein [Coriobacteriales bacterium]|jgi:putative ABC transport system ATP-binding protein|nr:ABC transporter ATP-binding protein [Coriobacteriales bacterium]
MSVILQATVISKVYTLGRSGEYQALKDVSLTIEQGEFVSVMGPSGSGKSSLLYCVSGMDKVSSGSISFAGLELDQLTEKDLAELRLQKMGFVFQQGNLLRNLSIIDNIVLAAYMGGSLKRADINQRAIELMQKTGILDLKDKDISQVSGGQMQRAAICRALINQPDMLFADEPTGALNLAATSEVMQILTTLNQEGMTIMLVTHDAKVAARSTRVLFMQDGQIVGEFKQGPLTSQADLPEQDGQLEQADLLDQSDQRDQADQPEQADLLPKTGQLDQAGLAQQSVLKARENSLSEWLAEQGF